MSDYADFVLRRRWPDALIGERRYYSGPLNIRLPRDNREFVLTETGWRSFGFSRSFGDASRRQAAHSEPVP